MEADPRPGAETTARALARSAAARVSLYDQLDEEFGLLTVDQLPESLRTSAWSSRLLSIEHRGETCYPAFQLDENGCPLDVVADLVSLADEQGRSRAGVVHWLLSPTTHLDGARPVDLLRSDPARVVTAAPWTWGVSW